MTAVGLAMTSGVATPADASDGDLVTAAQGGDTAAFEGLYRRHVGRTHALCKRLCGDAAEAEEMTQEAFVRAWQRLDRFHGAAAFGTWLHRLTVNTVLSSWRAAGRYRQRVVAISDHEEVSHPSESRTPGLAMDLERAIATLPRGARTVFVLHDIEGMLHREIADATGLAVGTCKTQLHRARKLLRSALSGESR
ncbi:MAG: RNA polymerase sigma factor [Acidobacteriota bacterium]